MQQNTHKKGKFNEINKATFALLGTRYSTTPVLPFFVTHCIFCGSFVLLAMSLDRKKSWPKIRKIYCFSIVATVFQHNCTRYNLPGGTVYENLITHCTCTSSVPLTYRPRRKIRLAFWRCQKFRTFRAISSGTDADPVHTRGANDN